MIAARRPAIDLTDALRLNSCVYELMKFSFSYIPDDNQSSNLDWINAKRRTLVRNTCDVYRNNKTVGSLLSSTYTHLITDDTHRAIYCHMPKIASTSMRQLLADRTSMKPSKPLSANNNAAERQYKLEHYKTILVVRNPFERLYSAYVDKFINGYKRLDSFKKYRNATKEMFPDVKESHGSLFITFEQFLKMITLAKKTPHLNYLDKARTDEHWATIYSRCAPCQVRYDFILKLHTINHDKELILPLFNATDLPSMNTGTSHRENIFNVKIPDIMTAYRNVKLDITQEIKTIYKRDLELFDYGFDKEAGILNY